MRTEVKDEFTDEVAEQLSGLIGDIIKMADGIFLWVRLVADELVEDLCEGDNAEGLRELLSTIPTEIEDLYTRAIRRTRRISLLTLTKQREEAYVMFQIAIYARQSSSIYLFLAATLFLTTGRRTYPDLQRLSLDQMERRLNNRSVELLDAPGRPISQDQPVRFIHQTVKEFMVTGKGGGLISENLSGKPQDSANNLILRYIINVLAHFNPHPLDSAVFSSEHIFAIDNFRYDAHKIEFDEGKCVSAHLEPAMSLGTDSELHHILLRMVSHIDKDHGREREDTLANMQARPQSRLLVFYAVCHLPLSLTQCVLSCKADVSEEISGLLLKSALFYMAVNHSPEAYRTLQALLESGIGANVSQRAFHELESNVEHHLSIAATQSLLNNRILELWAELRAETHSCDECTRGLGLKSYAMQRHTHHPSIRTYSLKHSPTV